MLSPLHWDTRASLGASPLDGQLLVYPVGQRGRILGEGAYYLLCVRSVGHDFTGQPGVETAPLPQYGTSTTILMSTPRRLALSFFYLPVSIKLQYSTIGVAFGPLCTPQPLENARQRKTPHIHCVPSILAPPSVPHVILVFSRLIVQFYMA